MLRCGAVSTPIQSRYTILAIRKGNLLMDRRRYLFQWLSTQGEPKKAPGSAISVDIAGVRLDLVTASPLLRDTLSTYFAQYRGEGAPRSTIFLEPLSPALSPKLWEDEDPEFECRRDMVVQRDFAAVRFHGANRSSTIVAGVHGEEPDDAIHNLLRWIMPELLLEASSLLMHAASVVHNGRGYLFFGQSGAGKSTTIALLSQGNEQIQILGDDASIMQMIEERAWLHSAPLGSGYSRLAPALTRVPLGGIYSLQQSKETQISPMNDAESLRALLASAMSGNFEQDSELRFDVAQNFIRSSCGIRKLYFQKSSKFWPLVQQNDRISHGQDHAAQHFVTRGT